MGIPKSRSGIYTYTDYLLWPDDERWELIHGVAYDMSPAPGRLHQEILGKLFRRIADLSDTLPCHSYVAPFDVRLPEAGKEAADEEISTVVQPDISVICNENLLDERGAIGAPDLVVEILSPATGYKDQTDKLTLYEKAGVTEYWIVNGEAQYVMVYRREGDRFSKPDYYRVGESVKSAVLAGTGRESIAIPLSDFM